MLDRLTDFATRLGVEPRNLILLGLCVGSLLFLVSLAGWLWPDRKFLRRMGARTGGGTSAADDGPEVRSVLRSREAPPTGVAYAFAPTSGAEQSRVRRELLRAGFDSPNALVCYYAIRVGAGLVLPAVLAALVLMRDLLPLPEPVSAALGRIPANEMLLLLGVLILVGFYLPAAWLASRTIERRQRIELAFPNALDLLQVSVEAGLGFDAALARVSEELHRSAPEISAEFRAAQQELLAGRDRDQAYATMAHRLGIEEAHAFVNVVLQSMRFGTSMGKALLTYSAEMRQRREIRAQEKANKLPVYMSAVMAGLMMPALLIVTIGPVVIRYTNGF